MRYVLNVWWSVRVSNPIGPLGQQLYRLRRVP